MMYLTAKNAGGCFPWYEQEILTMLNVYRTNSALVLLWTEFDRFELQIYEEVAKMPPFQRKTLVLIGAQGVGRRSLKNRLIVLNPLRYGTTVPCEWVSGWNRQSLLGDFLPGHMSHLSLPLFTFSHVTASPRRGERWTELQFCNKGRDGEGHQREPLPGAWRVRRQSLWHQDWLDPRSGGYGSHLHPGCQPSG